MSAPDSFPTLADVHAMHPRCVRCGEFIPSLDDAAHDVRPARLKHATESGCKQAITVAAIREIMSTTEPA